MFHHISHSALKMLQYSYRLCQRVPSVALTEECFQRHPLAFVGNTTDIVGAEGEVLHTIPASRTNIGTHPPGSEWTRNPIPDQHDPTIPPNFPPPVPNLAGHCCDEGCPSGCGDEFGTPWNIMDRVRVPIGLEPGDYVLSWRWDAEELPQVCISSFPLSLRVSKISIVSPWVNLSLPAHSSCLTILSRWLLTVRCRCLAHAPGFLNFVKVW